MKILKFRYRTSLVPGLQEILNLSPDNTNGLIGSCLSGAGPTVLIFADSSIEEISSKVEGIFKEFSVSSLVKILNFVSGVEIENV